MKENKGYRLVLSAVFCALVFTMTWIAIPAPSIGNINLGDCMIILCATLIGGWHGIFASALGAGLCDIASGYTIYAPGTFFIKALMVVVIILIRKLAFKNNKTLSIIVSGLCGEMVMILGYFIYEALILGYGMGAIMNIPFNAIQGILNLIAASLLFITIKKAGITKLFSDK